MKRLLPLMLALVLVISVIVPAYATGDGNFDGGGGGMGNGSKTNYWNPGMDGVRVSIVGVGSHSVVRNPIDLTNKVPAANVAHFGKVSKLSYNAGRGLSVSVSGYSYRNPSQSLPKIISTGSSKASIAAIRSYFTDEQVIRSIAGYAGMKQQTFVASGVVAKGNGDCFLSEERHTALSTGGGQAGQGYPCVLTAAFSAGAGASAGGIGYGEELSPTLKGSAGGNCMPSVLCLNDQGGSVMEYSENVSGTLRAQEHGHQPLVYENHGIDSRYTGPHKVAPTMSARYGTGGNNVPLVEQDSDAICIAGNIVDRQPQNGGNGLGCQDDLAYTLTATDRHAVFSRQRVDAFRQNNVASTQSARQYKDATDLICQQAEAYAYLIRRLTPLECERLQGFPDGWTDIPDASDSARYKALGNSVAIPCVEFIISRIAAMLRAA